LKHRLGELSNLGAGTFKLHSTSMCIWNSVDVRESVHHNSRDRIHRIVPVQYACDGGLCLAVSRSTCPAHLSSENEDRRCCFCSFSFYGCREAVCIVASLTRQHPDRSSGTRYKQQEVVWGAANVRFQVSLEVGVQHVASNKRTVPEQELEGAPRGGRDSKEISRGRETQSQR